MSELSLGQLKGLTINANRITIPSGHTLYAPGHVIQVVTGSTTTPTATTGTAWVDTTLSATITPKLASSKIIAIVTQALYIQRSSTYANAGFRLLRDATAIDDNASNIQVGIYANGSSAVDNRQVASRSYLDSPNSTSALVYKTQITTTNGDGTTITAQDSSKLSRIILLEVAA